MKKRIFSALMSMVMVFTMSLCVFAETDSTALEITNLVGTKKNLYVTLSENVSVTEGNHPTATVMQYGADTQYTTVVTAQDSTESTNKLEIAVSPALPIDGNFKLTLSADGKTAEQSFGYQTLYSEDFSDDSAKSKIVYSQDYKFENGKLVKIKNQGYSVVFQNIGANEDWYDYTVEYEYDNTLGNQFEGEKPMFDIGVYFYTNASVWSVNSNSLYSAKTGVTVINEKNKGTPYISYLPKAAQSNEDIVKKNSPDTFEGGLAAMEGKDVVYSASVFGNNVYSSITPVGEENSIYSARGAIDGELMYTSGGFCVYTVKHTSWTDASQYADIYIDNVLAYKLKTFNIDYSENTAVTYYGSKQKLVFDFDSNVLGADAVLKNYKTGEVIAAESVYDSINKKLKVIPASDLLIDGVYTIDIHYGIEKEFTKSMMFGYNVLYEDDFSNENKSKAFFEFASKSGIIDGNLARTTNQYMPIWMKAGIAANWSDYTVEFDWLDEKSHKKPDGTDYAWGDDTNYIPSLFVLFYADEDRTTGDKGSNTERPYALGTGTWAFEDGTQKCNVTYVPDNVPGAPNRIEAPYQGDYNSIKGKDSVRFSAGLFGKTAVVDVKDGADALYSFDYTVPKLGKTSGKFAINAFAAHAYSDGPVSYIDNLLVYKMKEVSVDYSDNESITAYGSKNKLMFKFDKDLHDAEVALKDAQGNTVNVTSSYDASKNAVFAAPESELDINKTYTATVNYGLVKEFSKDITFGFEVLYSDSFDDITKTEGYLKNIGNKNTDKKYEITADGKLHIGDRMYMPAYMKKGMADDSEVWKDYTVEYDWFDTISHQNTDGTDYVWDYKWNGAYDSYTPSLATLFYVTDNREAGEWKGDWVQVNENTGYNKTFYFGALVGTWMFADTANTAVRYVTQGTDREILNSAAPTSARGDYNAVKGKEQVKFSASMFGNTAVTTVKDGNTELFGYELDVPHLKNTSGKFAINSFAAHAYSDGPTAYIDNLLVYKMAVIGDGKLDIRYASFEKANNAVTVSGLNITDITEGFGLALAVYGENGTLLGVNFADTNSDSISVENIDTTKITDVKLMFWSKSNALKPVRGMMDLY